MSLTVEQIFIEALSLPAATRAELVQRLKASLGESDNQAENDQAWKLELEARCKAYTEGKLQSIPVERAMQEAYAKLK